MLRNSSNAAGAIGVHNLGLPASTCSCRLVSMIDCAGFVPLQAFTIIGGGRVGQALADMGPGGDVS